MGMKRCKHCEAEVSTSTVYCPKCGGKLKLRIRDWLVYGFIGGVCLMFAGCFALAWIADDVAKAQYKQQAIREADQAQARSAAIKAEETRKAAQMMETLDQMVDLAEEKEKAKQAKQADADRRAVSSLLMRIDSGSIAAKYSLAVRYLEGNGVELDKAKAITMLKECAAEDHRAAQKKLGELGEE